MTNGKRVTKRTKREKKGGHAKRASTTLSVVVRVPGLEPGTSTARLIGEASVNVEIGGW